MSLMYFEGTSDYVAATPVIITTFEASGSIAAGKLVPFMSATDQRVYQPPATYQGNSSPAGLAIATVANGDPCPVVVWGMCKNIVTGGAFTLLTSYFSISGSGLAMISGAASWNKNIGTVGRGITGSSNSTITAFINCM